MFCSRVFLLVLLVLASAVYLPRQSNLTSIFAPGLSPGASIHFPADPDYDEEVTPRYSTYVEFFCVVTIKPAIPEDVQYIVTQANANNIPFFTTGGGHASVPLFDNVNNAVKVELSSFNNVELDADLLTIGPSVAFSEVYDPLYNMLDSPSLKAGYLVWNPTGIQPIFDINARKIIPVGNAGCVNMIGATIGAGVGPFQGPYNLIIDSLRSVRLSILSYRGAGANFGIVVFATYEPYGASNGGQVIEADFLLPPAANQSFWEILASWDCSYPSQMGMSVGAGYNRTAGEEEAQPYLDPLIALEPVQWRNQSISWNRLTAEAGFGNSVRACVRGNYVNRHHLGTRRTDVATFMSIYNEYVDWIAARPWYFGSLVIQRYSAASARAVPVPERGVYPWRNIELLIPTGQCKPFDQAADGYCRADSVGLVVLKVLSQAAVQGDDILGVTPAIATNHGGLSRSITVPYGRAQTNLFRMVLQRSGLEPHQVSYGEAHGTGTQVGDPIEVASIREVFGDPRRHEALHIGSIEANIGHGGTAAGAASLLKVLAMLQRKELPPLAGFQTLNPKIPALETDGLHINHKVLPWSTSTKTALVNSYGASGSNSALTCSEAPCRISKMPNDVNLSYPIFISAAMASSLTANATKLAAYIRKNKLLGIGNFAFTLHERRKHHNLRWVTTASEIGALADALETYIDQSLFQFTKDPKKSAVLTFSGQSNQTIQLNRSLYRWFPRLRSYLERCDQVLRDLGYPAIIPVVFQPEPVADVVQLQCGTFAVQYACAMSWIDAGLEAKAVIGHSFGELTALAVAGVLSLEDGLKLVAGRASLMRHKWAPERGTMPSTCREEWSTKSSTQ
ncbi:hypothetical protein DL770_005339 [Monosporascus sp. CRB-9-2]|nr:hypothetical protein DL770_005339 [Monosporascus sp. CRB-9-2]